MQSDNDNLSKLIEDVDKATNSYFYDCGYFGSRRGSGCGGCPAEDCDSSCMQAAFDDIARRLHALMPHDTDGREIKVGDTIKRVHSGLQIHVADVVPLPVLTLDGDGTSRVAARVPHLWRVMEPDSWEKLEKDATMLPHDYLTTKDASDKRYGVVALTAMTADLVRRAKALAKAGEGL